LVNEKSTSYRPKKLSKLLIPRAAKYMSERLSKLTRGKSVMSEESASSNVLLRNTTKKARAVAKVSFLRVSTRCMGSGRLLHALELPQITVWNSSVWKNPALAGTLLELPSDSDFAWPNQ
jgi:hypothetical protein